jgi:hypothetical protein
MEGIFESTGTKWQDSHFAQPQAARRVKYMDVLNECIHDVPPNDIPSIDHKRTAT